MSETPEDRALVSLLSELAAGYRLAGNETAFLTEKKLPEADDRS